MVADADLLEIDRWALAKLEELIGRVERSYQEYEFHVLYHAVHNFCSVEMSAFYLDVLKDRLYASAAGSRLRCSAQTAMYRILEALTRLIAPVLSFTAEEIWSHLPGRREESVHLARFPEFVGSYRDAELEERFEELLTVRSDVAKALELARNDKIIGHSLDARVLLAVPEGPWRTLLDRYREDLAAMFIVSQVDLVAAVDGGRSAENVPGMQVGVEKAQGDKCERCWNYSTTVGDSVDHPTVCARCRGVLEV